MATINKPDIPCGQFIFDNVSSELYIVAAGEVYGQWIIVSCHTGTYADSPHTYLADPPENKRGFPDIPIPRAHFSRWGLCSDADSEPVWPEFVVPAAPLIEFETEAYRCGQFFASREGGLYMLARMRDDRYGLLDMRTGKSVVPISSADAMGYDRWEGRISKVVLLAYLRLHYFYTDIFPVVLRLRSDTRNHGHIYKASNDISREIL